VETRFALPAGKTLELDGSVEAQKGYVA